MTEKKAFFNELIDLLSQENDIHDRLIGVARDLNKSARDKDLGEIQQRCTAYDELICGLEKMEDRRIELCEFLMGLTGGQTSGRLLSLAEHSEPTQKTRLMELKSALTKRVAELKAVNTSNTIIFREALGEIDLSVSAIRESSRPKSGYRHKGDFKPAKSHLSIFNEVA